MRRARVLGLDVGLLPAWFDVDTAADLARLEAALAAPGLGRPPHATLLRAAAGGGQAVTPRDRAPQRGAGAHGPLEAVGALPERAAVGHRARGLQPRTATPGSTSRTTTRARAPIAGARTASPASPTTTSASASRWAFWNGRDPDPEGAAVRPHRRRGQPRRGRQGVLLLPRLHADALLHEVPLQVSAGGLSVRGARGGEPPARPERAGVRAARHRRLRRGPLLRRR